MNRLRQHVITICWRRRPRTSLPIVNEAVCIRTAAAIIICVLLAGCRLGPTVHAGSENSWNVKRAAAYLDQRAEWWMAWPEAARDHGTFCVSCHTAVPYALARPALRASLGETDLSAPERRLLNDVIKRVQNWDRVQPYYPGRSGAVEQRSRGTESVLNALVLTAHDAGTGTLSNDTCLALQNMWSLQQTSGDLQGAWWWLQFNNEPFEAPDSVYYGAVLAAVAVGTIPSPYRSSPEIRNNLALLRGYLDREYEAQSALNRAGLLWASINWPELITPERRQALISDLFARQQSDGGWNLVSLAWTWKDWTFHSFSRMFIRSYGSPLKMKSDGYATAFITFVLEQARISRENEQLQQAISWLRRNQNGREGYWQSYSLNDRRDPSSPTGRFMTDAATAYAVLALTAPPDR